MSAPAFLSFPDLGETTGDNKLEAGLSDIPAFSSFPDIDSAPKRSEPHVEDHPREGPSKRRRRDDGERPHRDRHNPERGHGRVPERKRSRERESRSSRRDREEGRSRRKEEAHKERSDRHRDDKEYRRERSQSRDREKKDRRDRDYRDRDRDRAEKRSRHDKERDSDERRLEKERRRARDRERAEALKVNDPDDGRAWYETSGLANPAASTASLDWFVDTVGDDDILRYREVATRNPPRYYRDYGGRIFGLSGDVRAVRSREHNSLEVSPFGRPYIPRYSARVIDGSLHKARLLMRPKIAWEGELDADFLPLDTGKRRALQDTEDDLPDYRAITKEQNEDDAEYGDMVAVLGDLPNVEDDLKAQRAEYERRLNTRPDDVEGWIKYSTMHLQDFSVAVVPDDLRDPAKAPQTLANAEVTLSVLQRAFDAHRANFASTALHIAYLRAAEQLWPADKVTERWKNVIVELGRSVPEEEMMKVYLAYIDWREGQGIGVTGSNAGGVDEVTAVYIDCIERLSGIDRDNEAREENQVYLLLRACLFLKAAGYGERALAVMQAAMEVTFFKPAYLRPPIPPFDRERWFSGILMEFEDFWDSEVPRIGEHGAQGWRSTHESEAVVEPPPIRPRNLDTGKDGDPYAQWYRAERRAEQALNLPGRARDLDPPGDDPFHMIMFEDVAPFLFPVQTPLVRLQLIYAFLTFLGLPFTPPEAPTSSPSASDPHLRWPLASNETMRAAFWPPRPTMKRIVWQTVGGTPMEAEQPRTLRSPFGCPAKSWMSERGTLFASDRWFRDVTAADLLHVDVDFTRNVLALMRPLVPDPSFVLSTFAFETALSYKGAVRAAKSILAGDSDNLILWDGYARLEQQRGKLAAARQVYVTALHAAEQRATLAGINKDDLEQDMDELWAAWAEMEYETGDEDLCLQVITMAAGFQRERIAECTSTGYNAQQPSPITMLKSKQHYATASSTSQHQLVLGAIFVTLTDGIEAARDRLLNVVDSLPAGDPRIEETLQLLVKVIFVHNSRHSSPASLMRNVLERAIELCPNNTIFLSLYLFGEGNRRVYGNVHRLTSRLITEDRGIVPLLWAVWAESQGAARTFYDKGGSGAERARRALNQSVNSPKGRQCAGLWLLYIEFEMLMGRPKAAKELCYRAMAAVGGCKDLYLLPFSTLRTQFSSRELREVVELMLERGIRVRVDTQDFWDHDHITDDEDESDDDMVGPVPDDYEYGMLREREVLKPY
ncbi:uncharacterized protein CcaverHIS019_0206360 [Cutaneotrichosporon cavernicola]|uniref:DUF1740-domain-containing protein n=1 Tax=Cutaneotrichosporon cavernicola TaxID=279322 RepID=A0AA48I134_9TREE|nr:uncharacterized protein CcaverHIS019_0206360 [Cutaneotrichosporon cavernicola]BEI89274.1 hypothetical protein CcaverHIS019_0206360 [Cutaneotrichosporon cavernicola]